MRPRIIITVDPDDMSDYAYVTVDMIAIAEDGKGHIHRAYKQLRLAQGLGDSMAIEPWLLASISEHTDSIKAALASLINQGIRTLMVETEIRQ